MSKVTTIGIIVFLLGSMVFAAGFFFLGQKKTDQSSTTNLPSPQASGQQAVVVQSPIDMSNPAILYSALIYMFEEIIDEVRVHPSGIELITKSSKSDFPRFIVTNRTNIYTSSDKRNFTRTNITALKPKQRVDITIHYSLKDRIWFTYAVTILEGTPATPSAVSTTSAIPL